MNEMEVVDDILYVKTINSEWKLDGEAAPRSFRERCESVSESQNKGSAWSYLLNLSLSQCNLDCYSSDISRLIDAQADWKVVLSNSRDYLAVLQDFHVEIRSSESDLTDVLSKWAIPEKDLFPQWRCLAWAPDDSILAISDSSGNVFLYNIVGNQHSHITSSKPQNYDLGDSVCSLTFKDLRTTEQVLSNDQHWFCELLVLTYRGNLTTYIVSQEGDYRLLHTFSFEDAYPRGVIHSVYLPTSSLLLIGGGAFWKDGTMVTGSDENQMLQHGVSAWRVLSGFPYYKHVMDYDLGSHKSSVLPKKFPSRRLWSWSNDYQGDMVFKMAASPDCSLLVTLHTSENICVWNLPSLGLIKKFETNEQPERCCIDPDILENPKRKKAFKDSLESFYIVDMAWWSNKDIIISRGTGSLTVSSIENLTNRLGSFPEFFQPGLSLLRFSDGCFYVLECQKKYGTSKREIVQNENDDEMETEELFMDSDEESQEGGVTRKISRYVKQGLYYVTDMDAFQPPKKKPKMVMRTYRLICLKSTTPTELYASKLDNEEYGEALLLARTYNLDCDLTYQRQWKQSPVTVATIQDYLSKISKRSWVLHECLERVPQNLDAMDELLKYGLRGTDLDAIAAAGNDDDDGRFVLCEFLEEGYRSLDCVYDDGYEEEKELIKKKRKDLLDQIDFNNLTLNQKELCRIRLKLLHYSDKLETYQDILGGKFKAFERYDSIFFDKFRTQNIIERAVEFAQLSDISALSSLFTYHGDETLPHRMAILSNIPEMTPPDLYADLLPRMSIKGSERYFEDWNTAAWRNETDWCESYCSPLSPVNTDDLGSFLYEENVELLRVKDRILTDEQLTSWFKWRSLEIEKMSGQVDCSLTLVKLGIENNILGLYDLHDDMATMETLVYDCNAGMNFTFNSLLEMSLIERICLMMAKTTREMFMKNLRRWVVPYLEKQESKVAGSYHLLLKEYMVIIANDDLTFVELIFKESKQDKTDPIIRDSDNLVSIASECIYAHTGFDQLSMIKSIILCLPDKPENLYDLSTKVIDEKGVMSCHHLGAEILKKNGIEQTLAQIRDIQKCQSEATKLLTRIARTSTKKRPPMSESELRSLFTDMCLLQENVFTCVLKAVTYEIFVGALLCSGTPSHIRLAGTVMGPAPDVTSPTSTSEDANKQKPAVKSVRAAIQNSLRSTISPFKGASKPSSAPVSSFSSQSPTSSDLLPCTIDRSRSICLVLDAAREYFNSSASVSDHDMTLARSCLDLIKDKPPIIQDELNLIEALAMLESLGVTMLPVHVRMTEDRLSLIKKVSNAKKMMYKNYTKLHELGRLLKVANGVEKDLQGQILNLIARYAHEAQDYTVCLDSCKKLMSLSYKDGWEVCKLLGENEDFEDNASKSSLLKFALLHCPDENLNEFLEASSQLDTMMSYREVYENMSPNDPYNIQRAGSPPFQTKPQKVSDNVTQGHSMFPSSIENSFISQSKHVFSLTRSAFGHIGDTHWWSNVVSNAAGGLKRFAVSENKHRKNKVFRAGSSEKDLCESFTKQACHPFYETLHDSSVCSVHESADYSDVYKSNKTLEEDLNEHLLRIYMSDMKRFESDADDGGSGGGDDEPYELITQVLLQMAESTLPHDTSLGMAYLLAVPDVFHAEKCFDRLPRTPHLFQLAIYYFALRIADWLKISGKSFSLDIFLINPNSLVQQVLDVIRSKQSDWPAEIEKMIDRMFHYNDLLLDHLEAEVLTKMDRGIDTLRFVSEETYKKETILGMALCMDDELFSVALSLATRYKLPLQTVYMTHLGYLFDDPSITTEEIQERINNLDMLKIFKKNSTWFTQEMEEKVFNLIHGRDLNRLLIYFNLLALVEHDNHDNHDDNPDENGLPPTLNIQSSPIQRKEGKGDLCNKREKISSKIPLQSHIKMLNKFKNVAPELNYMDLMQGNCEVENVLIPVLNSNNVATFAKFAQNFPDRKGRQIDTSFVHRCHATNILSNSNVENDNEWPVRYRACLDSIQKMSPQDLIAFVNENLFGMNSIKKIPLESRKQILKNLIKHCTQQFSGETKRKSKVATSWEEVVCVLQKDFDHLDRMSSDVISRLLTSDNTTLQQYAIKFDLTQSKTPEVKMLLMKMITAGENVEFVNGFINLLNHENFLCWQLYMDVVGDLCTSLKKQDSDNSLQTIKRVLNVVSRHVSTGGLLINLNEISDCLKSIASDSAVDGRARLEILSIIKENSPSNNDSNDILHSQTCAVLSLLGELTNKITVKEVSEESGRVTLFKRLLDFHSSADKLFHLVQLLNIWPPLQSSDENLWYCLIEKLITASSADDKENIRHTLQLIHEAMLKNNLSYQEIENISDMMASKDCLSACKIQLSSLREQLVNRAVGTLNTMPQDTEDKELFLLIINRHLISRCTGLRFYPKIIDFMLSHEDVDPQYHEDDQSKEPIRSADSALGQLQEPSSQNLVSSALKDLASSGQKPEAGTIFMAWKSVHPGLRSFDAAISFADKFLSK